MDQQNSNARQTQMTGSVHKRHLRGLWPIVIILTVAVIAAGVIIWNIYNSSINDDINSTLSTLIYSKHHRQSPYYGNLQAACLQQSNQSCCAASVKIMAQNNYKLSQNHSCPVGYRPDKALCTGSYEWCERTQMQHEQFIIN